MCVCVPIRTCEGEKDETLRGEDGLRMETIKIYRDKEKHSDLQWDSPEHRNPRGSFQAQIYIFTYFKMIQPRFCPKYYGFRCSPCPTPHPRTWLWENRHKLGQPPRPWNTSPTTSYWALGFLPPLVKLLELLLSNYKVLHEARPQWWDCWHWAWQLSHDTAASKACSMPLSWEAPGGRKSPARTWRCAHPSRCQSPGLRKETQSLSSPGAEVRLCCKGVTSGHLGSSGEGSPPPAQAGSRVSFGLMAPCS